MAETPAVDGHEGECRYCGIRRDQELPRPSYQELRSEVERLRGLLNEAHLTRIAAQNPGIDIERVRAERGW